MTQNAASVQLEIRVEDDACYIADSTLPNAGKGLFAAKDLSKDTFIIEYTGEILTFQQAKQKKDRSYMKAVGLDRHIDAVDPSKSSAARYINDNCDIGKRNCKFHKQKDRVFVRTTRDVSKDEEFFIEYGRGHWLYCEDLTLAEAFLGLEVLRSGTGGVKATTDLEVRSPICTYSSLHWKRKLGPGLGIAVRKQSKSTSESNCRLLKNPLLRGTVLVQSSRPIKAGEELIMESLASYDPQVLKAGAFVTGFGKFRGVPENPTTKLMANLKPFINELGILGSAVWETSIHGVNEGLRSADVVIKSQYTHAKNLVPTSIVYVHFGVDDSADCFALESTAVNIADFGIPDEQGSQPFNEPIEHDVGSKRSVRRTGVDLVDVCDRLEALGHKVAISKDAGRYICNYAYYSSLKKIREADWGHDDSLFVHVPSLRVFTEEQQLQFARDLLMILTREVIPSRNAFNLSEC